MRGGALVRMADDLGDDPLAGLAEQLDPDHPLLARAQAALKAQLVGQRDNVEAELREAEETLRVRPSRWPFAPPLPAGRRTHAAGPAAPRAGLTWTLAPPRPPPRRRCRRRSARTWA